MDKAENFGSVEVEAGVNSVLSAVVVVDSTLDSSTTVLIIGVSATCVLRSAICLSSTIE